MKICLDAGHYGKYNRSKVVPEYYESDMNWKLHLKLKAELEKYGIDVITTRKEQNKDLALETRGKMSKGCDLFLSLHSNAASTEPVNHVVGIYQVDDDCGKMDEQSRKFAEKISECVAGVMGGVKAKTYSRESSTDRDKNGHKDDYYGVLRGAHTVGTPGVIIEHGFHTNTAQAKWLLVDANLNKLAKAEAALIADFFGVTKSEDKVKPETPKPTVSTYTLTLPLLKMGSNGEHVKALQRLLIANGIKLPKYGADGDFGGETEKGVIEYQRKVCLDDDGIVGSKTMGKLLGV